jgi:hypothetical protein
MEDIRKNIVERVSAVFPGHPGNGPASRMRRDAFSHIEWLLSVPVSHVEAMAGLQPSSSEERVMQRVAAIVLNCRR